MINVPKAHLTSFSGFQEDLHSNELSLAVYQRILGQASGVILSAFSNKSGHELVHLLSNKPIALDKKLTEMDEDILCELANIITGSYLTTLSKMTNIMFMASVPHLNRDISQAALEKKMIEGLPTPLQAFVILNELIVD